MIKFFDAVKIKTSSCAVCHSAIYQLPFALEPGIVEYFTNFGSPKYPLKSVKLLRIDSDDGFHIEGRIGTKTIKFVMPRKFEKVDPRKILRKIEFETCLAKWLSKVLDIPIITSEQE